MTNQVDVLLPTRNRIASLAMTLTSLAAQSLRDFRLIVSDQSDVPALKTPTIASLKRVFEAHGRFVEWHERRPRGIAEQRAFLLDQARADMVLYLDDDVFMEPWVLEKMAGVLKDQDCGFVGAFPSGLSFRNDVRPAQQKIEFWQDRVRPEAVEPDSQEWQRFHLHRAANLYHVAQQAGDGVRLYKVAWVASCVLYDRRKLLQVGGFSFWPRLPRFHSGEEVLVQNLLMRRFGGCGMLPSGTFHSEEDSTVLNAEGSVDGHALELLPQALRVLAGTRTGDSNA